MCCESCYPLPLNLHITPQKAPPECTNWRKPKQRPWLFTHHRPVFSLHLRVRLVTLRKTKLLRIKVTKTSEKIGFICSWLSRVVSRKILKLSSFLEKKHITNDLSFMFRNGKHHNMLLRGKYRFESFIYSFHMKYLTEITNQFRITKEIMIKEKDKHSLSFGIHCIY